MASVFEAPNHEATINGQETNIVPDFLKLVP